MTSNTQQTTSATELLSVKKLVGYGAILAVILSTQSLYHDYLYRASHDVIVGLQAERSQESFDFYNWLSNASGEGVYACTILMLLPFMSMERFWYLLIAFQTTEFAKSVLKLSFHEPRPTWVWDDVLPIGCSASFGLPSGHCSEAANFVLVILLDMFKPSNWSRANHPTLNTKTISNSPYAFAAVLMVFFTYWPLVVFDRVVLGKHTMNQAVTGSLVGFWCAAFAHFCLRDAIFFHVNKIANGKMQITYDQAAKYARAAIILFLSMLTTAVLVSYLNANRAHIE